MKKLAATILALVLVFAFATNSLAYWQGLQGAKVYGGSPSKVLTSGSREYDKLTVIINTGSSFNTEANMTFRNYKVGASGTSDRRSNAVSMYLSDWYNGQTKTASFINGGGSESKLDLRASVPNTNSTAYALFYGVIKF